MLDAKVEALSGDGVEAQVKRVMGLLPKHQRSR